MPYTAPTTEQRFVLDVIADLPGLAALPAYANATPDTVDAILAESGKLAANVFAPLNKSGDKAHAKLDNGVVTLPAGFVEAYGQYVQAGWAGLGVPEAHGGQGLPFAVAVAVQEQLTSANMAFALCMMLSQGAIEALAAHASQELQERYLSKLVTGEWTGTMNLTEPTAGSDVGALKSRAEPNPDGSWRIKGTKIFITWGEHDAADNIVHLVLARTPDSPAGTKGISLFLVPKFLPGGTRNDLKCVGLEHKLGIHASPTCTMSFGDHDQCIGWMVGREGGGMRAMFTMMNNARVQVGLQGAHVEGMALGHGLGAGEVVHGVCSEGCCRQVHLSASAISFSRESTTRRVRGVRLRSRASSTLVVASAREPWAAWTGRLARPKPWRWASSRQAATTPGCSASLISS
jgi:alkylation response protein AidB-like acyl-CoA dehydrogenase